MRRTTGSPTGGRSVVIYVMSTQYYVTILDQTYRRYISKESSWSIPESRLDTASRAREENTVRQVYPEGKTMGCQLCESRFIWNLILRTIISPSKLYRRCHCVYRVIM